MTANENLELANEWFCHAQRIKLSGFSRYQQEYFMVESWIHLLFWAALKEGIEL